jgi:hypothetical protein
MNGEAQRDPTSDMGRRSVSRGWRPVAIAIGLALIVTLTVAFIPAVSRREIMVQPFGYTLLATAGLSPYFIQAGTFCAPSNSLGPGTVSFTWSTESGAKLFLFTIVVPVGGTPGNDTVTLYTAANVSSGGFSYVAESPFPCEYVLPLTTQSNSTTDQTVLVSGTFVYNYTATLPIL